MGNLADDGSFGVTDPDGTFRPSGGSDEMRKEYAMENEGSSGGDVLSGANAFVRAALALLDPKKLIDGLDPGVRTKFRGLVLVIAMLGFGKVQVVSGRRTDWQQAGLWGRGRTSANCEAAGVDPCHAEPASEIVTWTLPRYSKHVSGEAIDIDLSEYEESAFEILGHAARSVGVEWGGDWKVRDYGHFEA